MNENTKYLIERGWKYIRRGNELLGKCPSIAHKDDNPSFSINETTGAFRCLSCGISGKSLVSLMIYAEGITKEEAVRKINPHHKPLNFGRLSSAMDALVKLTTANLTKSDAVAEFLNKKGITMAEAAKWRIGYADSSVAYEIQKQQHDSIVTQMKIFSESGIFLLSNRIVIPVTRGGRVIGMTSRSMDGTNPKYRTNTIVPYSDFFFNLDPRHKDYVFLTEGAFDAIAVERFGHNATALIGTEVGVDRVGAFGRFKNIGLVLDNDKAGVSAMIKFTLNALKVIPNSKVWVIPVTKDPDEYTKSEFDTVVSQKVPAIDFMISKSITPSNVNSYAVFLRRIQDFSLPTIVEKAIIDKVCLTFNTPCLRI